MVKNKIKPFAYLIGANLSGADLCGARLSGANLSGANLDFSCWPLSCKSVGVKVDDKHVFQLLWHLGKVDVSNCSQMAKDTINHIRAMAASDVFSDEYRTELKGQEEDGC